MSSEPERPADPPAPKAPNPLLKKVRKVSGELSELGTMGTGGAPGSKPTDFRWAMDRDLDKLAEVVEGPWGDMGDRPQAVAAMKSVIWALKMRADRSGYMLLSEVCLKFMDYLSHVANADQKRDAIENYFAAVRVISKKNIIGRGGMLGEAMLTDLTTLNKKAGVKVE